MKKNKNAYDLSKAEPFMTLKKGIAFLLAALLLTATALAGEPMTSKTEEPMESENVIYLAGGCFWGLEKLMQSIPGVTDAVSGYANGTGEADANYRTVVGGNTGFRETVKVTYDPEQVSLDALLLAYFYVIDPTVENRQGNDVGSQYQTGVYYADEASKETVERIAALERGRSEKFAVEFGPLVNFFPAEEYHQDYLDKNPNGYCHIPRAEIELFSKLKIDPGDYKKPAEESIRDKLTEALGVLRGDNRSAGFGFQCLAGNARYIAAPAGDLLIFVKALRLLGPLCHVATCDILCISLIE